MVIDRHSILNSNWCPVYYGVLKKMQFTLERTNLSLETCFGSFTAEGKRLLIAFPVVKAGSMHEALEFKSGAVSITIYGQWSKDIHSPTLDFLC